MKLLACCRGDSWNAVDRSGRPAPAGNTRAPRAMTGALEWLFAAAGLALLPKCPACLAAWVAAGTGLGLSFAAASRLQTAIIVGCAIALAAAAVPRILTHRGWRSFARRATII